MNYCCPLYHIALHPFVKTIQVTLLSIFFSFTIHCQTFSQTEFNIKKNDSLLPATIKRDHEKWLIPAILLSVAGGSLYVLSTSWYKNYPSHAFHFVNDLGDWRMMDKGGHAWAAYHITKLTDLMWQMEGLSHKRSVYRAAITALGYQTSIEIMDGFSSEYGFSWSDMGANSIGVLLYLYQELHFCKQLVYLKFLSLQPVRYAANLHDRAVELFGNSYAKRLLNDYNGQTYWACMNLRTIFPHTRLPAWLSIAVGYGAGNMLGKQNNTWVDKNGTTVNYNNIPRYTRFLLSPDINFASIKTNHAWLHTLLNIFNAFKMPAPALEYRQGKFRLQWLLLH